MGGGLGIAGAVPVSSNYNPYVRIVEGKFPEPYSQRILIGGTQGSKVEIGMSQAGRIDVKIGGFRSTIRPGNKNMCE